MRTTKRLLEIPLLALFLVACAGCPRRVQVRVVMTPTNNDALERTFEVSYTGKTESVPVLFTEMVTPATKLYGAPKKVTETAQSFAGTFERVPGDIVLDGQANRGSYHVWRSPLGSFHYYKEILPGCTKPYQWFERGTAWVDRLAKVCATVARQQLAGEQGLDRLVAFIQSPLKQDVKELLFLLHTSAAAHQARGSLAAGEDRDWRSGGWAITYLLQFASDRGYFEVEDVVGVFPADKKSQFRFVKGLIARRMGQKLDAQLAAKLSFIEGRERLDSAFRSALEAEGMDGEKLRKEAGRFVRGYFHLDFSDQTPTPTGSFVLKCGREPIASNGKWCEPKRSVSWSMTLMPNYVLAPLIYAAWSVPDEAWQKKHLGGTVLAEEELCQFVLLEHWLSEKQRTAWHAVLHTLVPGRDISEQIIRATRQQEPEDERLRQCAEAFGDALRSAGKAKTGGSR